MSSTILSTARSSHQSHDKYSDISGQGKKIHFIGFVLSHIQCGTVDHNLKGDRKHVKVKVF